MTDNKTKKIIRSFLYAPNFIRDIIFCYIKLGAWDSSWRFRGLPIIQRHPNAKINIKKKFLACSNPRQNSIGVFQKVTIKALAHDANISIGCNVGVSGATISGKNITISDNVLIGSGVLITDNDAHPIHPELRNDSSFIESAPVVIEKNVFIGARAIILKGVTIGEGSVIGAGAVVSKNVPKMSIAAGNPAKIVKKIF